MVILQEYRLDNASLLYIINATVNPNPKTCEFELKAPLPILVEETVLQSPAPVARQPRRRRQDRELKP